MPNFAFSVILSILLSLMMNMNFCVNCGHKTTAKIPEADIPWTELAFPSVEHTLKHYFEDRKNNIFPMHLETLGTRLDHTG